MNGALTKGFCRNKQVSTIQTQAHLIRKHVSHNGEGLNDGSDDDNEKDRANLTAIKNSPHVRYSSRHFHIPCVIYSSQPQLRGEGTIDIIFILQMGKLRHRCK